MSAKAKTSVPSDAPELIQTLAKVEATLRHDASGNVIEVDLRGKTISDEALQAMSGLSQLTSLLLADSKLEARQVPAIAKLAALQNLDLRECAIDDHGIQYRRFMCLSGSQMKTQRMPSTIAQNMYFCRETTA